MSRRWSVTGSGLNTKRGKVYEYATSTDFHATFRPTGTRWGDGAPKRIGILAKNGGNKDAPELDAAFEFFELRSISSEGRATPGRTDTESLG